MKFIIIQVLIFALGVMLLLIDGSGGYTSNMTWVSYLGIAACIIGVGGYILKGIIGLVVFNKKNKS